MAEHVIVGLGVIIVNKDGKILIGKRKGFVPKFALPGGHLDAGETFEQGGVREIKEEANLDIFNPKVIGISNNLETFKETGKHYISIFILATEYSGELKLAEPEKCEEWRWCDPNDLPQPLFDASRMGVELYLKNKFYIA
jgi:ADP-ribose pyrophosphatase YjhB (NUDIX family)